MPTARVQGGFGLIELVMVIVILGVVGATVAVFMRQPVDAYVDTTRRAALSDLADGAVRRISRDVRRALPNSVRNPSSQCIEFIPTRTGGRYRAALSSTGTGDMLDFSIADTSFGVFGDLSGLPPDQRVAVGDVVVVYNLGIAGANAYDGDNTAAVTGTADLDSLSAEPDYRGTLSAGTLQNGVQRVRNLLYATGYRLGGELEP